MLRDPVSRAISHYGHSCNLGFEDLLLEEALMVESQRLRAQTLFFKSLMEYTRNIKCSYLNRSLYRNQVYRYWEYFGRENVYILLAKLFLSLGRVYRKSINFYRLNRMLCQMRAFLVFVLMQQSLGGKNLRQNFLQGSGMNCMIVMSSCIKNLVGIHHFLGYGVTDIMCFTKQQVGFLKMYLLILSK